MLATSLRQQEDRSFHPLAELSALPALPLQKLRRQQKEVSQILKDR